MVYQFLNLPIHNVSTLDMAGRILVSGCFKEVFFFWLFAHVSTEGQDDRLWPFQGYEGQENGLYFSALETYFS